MELCSHWGFLISSRLGHRERSGPLPSGAPLLDRRRGGRRIDLEMPGNHVHRQVGQGPLGPSGVGACASAEDQDGGAAVSHGTRDLRRVGHVLVRILLVNGCARFVLLSLKGARQDGAVLP